TSGSNHCPCLPERLSVYVQAERVAKYPRSSGKILMARAEESLVPSPHFRSRDSGQGFDSALDNAVAESTQRTCDWLLSRQHTDGYWCGELEGDTILESEYILLLAWLRQENEPLAKK